MSVALKRTAIRQWTKNVFNADARLISITVDELYLDTTLHGGASSQKQEHGHSVNQKNNVIQSNHDYKGAT